MPKITGVFDSFENLEKIPVEKIASWFNNPPEIAVLENFLANRIIYSQVVPVTAVEQNIDLAILKEALRANPVFYKQNQNKMFIPESFLQITPDIKKLVNIYIEAYEPTGLVTFVLATKTKDEILGSFVKAVCKVEDSLLFDLEGKSFTMKPGSMIIIPCRKEHCHVSFKSSNSTIFGKTELIFEIPGGNLGLVVDGRIK